MAVKVKKATGDEKLVVNQIIIKAPNRATSNIGTWRNANTNADKGKVKAIYDLFEDLMLDGILSNAITKRIDAIKLAELTFQDANGEENEQMIQLIDSPGFEQLLDTIMQVRFWGRAGGEFNFNIENGFEFEPLPFKHIKLENKSILINDSDESGVPYEGDDHLLILGKPRQFGLLMKAAPFAIWKRGGFGDWAEWLEIFGMPQRIGKYNANDPQSKQLLEEAFEKAGSAPWVVVPKESEITQTNLIGNSTGGAHNDFVAQCNVEMLVTILGQIMTTLDGSSLSQSKTHMEVLGDITKADMKYVQRVLNHFVKPILEKRGFPVSGGSFIFPESPEALTVEEIVKLADIIEIPSYFIHDRYGIPVAADGETVARKASPTGGVSINRVAGQPADPGEPIENSESNFFKQLWNFFASAPGSGATFETPIKLADDSLTDRIIQHAVGGVSFHPDLFEFIRLNLLTALDAKAVKLADLGFTYSYESDAFRTAQELNIFHFSAAKDIAEIQQLNELYRKSKTFDEFYKLASEKVNVFNKVWQRTEYQSATLISEATSTYNRLKSKTNIFPYWKYKTVGDSKVRDEHRKLNGLILHHTDPRWNKIFPPNGWKCRCYVVGVMAHEVEGVDIAANQKAFDEYLESTDFATAKANGFGVNRAVSANIFAENQMYIAKFKDQSSKWLKDVNYRTYNLGSFEANRKNAGEMLTRFQGGLNELEKLLKTENGRTFATDYQGRSIALDVEKWKRIHASQLNERLQYTNAALAALKAPDEVWVNAQQEVYRLTEKLVQKATAARKAVPVNKLSQYVFLKYYKDETICVIANIHEGNVYEVVTWFPVVENAANAAKFRSGLLIKSPKP